jgi:triphosphoribosyl-dephospho-CoA synthase
MKTILPLAARRWYSLEPKVQQAIDLSSVARTAEQSLIRELETWLKPGLVSHVDSGSHRDMDADTFRASASAIAPYFRVLAEAGTEGTGMGRLRVIGLEAEAAMLKATAGINTHRGAIFGLGLLCAAAGARIGGQVDPTLSLGKSVSRLWGSEIVDGPVLLLSHGSKARRRYGAGGARTEAALGFPSVYSVGIPSLRRAVRIAPADPEAQRVQTCFALIAAVEDTNLLHRGGQEGLRFARQAAQDFLNDGGIATSNWRDRARKIHLDFVDRRLSPGGSADLLAMTLFVENNERRIS